MPWFRAPIKIVSCLGLVVCAIAASSAPNVVEFGAQADGHGSILAPQLDSRNTPGTVAVTADGAVWFRESFDWHPRIARFGPKGDFQEFPDPYHPGMGPASADGYYNAGSALSPLVADGDDVLVGPVIDNRVTVMSPDGSVHERPAPGCLAAGPDIACLPKRKDALVLGKSFTPTSITRGFEGSLWFTDTQHSLIGRIAANGAVTTFTRGLTRWFSGPQFITAGPDGTLWFTEKRDRIGRITRDGRIAEFSDGIPHRSSIGGIIAGPDGNMWFTLFHGMVLGRMTMSGVVTLYHDLVYPSDGHEDDPVSMLTRDRSGRLYYNEGQAGRIARVTIR